MVAGGIFRTMVHRLTLLRSVRLLAAIVQIVVPGLVVSADAHIDHQRLVQPTHIEAAGHDCQSRGHPLDCAVCQFLRTAAVVRPSLELAPTAAPTEDVERSGAIIHPSGIIHPGLPRGPPLHS